VTLRIELCTDTLDIDILGREYDLPFEMTVGLEMPCIGDDFEFVSLCSGYRHHLGLDRDGERDINGVFAGR